MPPPERWTPPESTRVNEPRADPGAGPAADPSALERAAGKVTGLRRALQVQPDDPKHVAAAKIAAVAGLAILLLVVSPLILFGLFTGLAVAA